MIRSDRRVDRREYFRVWVAPDEPVRVYLRLSERHEQVFLARVDSISVGGVGIVLNLLENSEVPPGVGEGILHLPTLGRVKFEGMIEWNTGARVGVRFTKISEQDKSMIFRYVVKRERETTKR
ncbi:MAG: PilZ domain-containing protein [Acidobacteria bacterium]|nr:PilZ domain-containing protein [Acidobacteriota bacterium]MBI3657476.1 PilZ domain-containing protein [Acidobacteriota bacterium]